MPTIVLLSLSNLFMTFAWYGHLKFLHDRPLWVTILVSWGIAFFEYCLMVPANRLGYGRFTGYELKIIQEIITLVVFVGFAWLVLGERLRWNYAVSLVFIALAAYFAFGINRSAPAAG
ncbi:MAG: DMT family protein [Opitutales bacterium]